MRAFVALDLDDASRARIAALGDALAASPLAPRSPKPGFTDPEKMHVTLAFLGDTDEALVPTLDAELAAIGRRAADAGAFRDPAPMKALTAFGSPARARVVVAELDDATGALADVARAVATACAPLGFVADPRPYRPHVTLARLRAQTDARRWLAAHEEVVPPGTPLTLRALALYRSDPGPRGTVYVPLVRVSLV